MSDINSLPWVQFNPLTRLDKFRYYISLPAFNYSPAYTGDSELVTQFNFSASRNFYLRNRPAKPSGVNYLLCIRYRVGDTVYRYKLWNGVGETGMDEVPLYNAQLIKKNFVLEVWSVGTTASQATAITIITSVTGIITDITNVSNAALAVGTEFNSYSNTNAVPASPVFTMDFRAGGIAAAVDAAETNWTNAIVGNGDAIGAASTVVQPSNALYKGLYQCNFTCAISYAFTPFAVSAAVFSVTTWTPNTEIIRFEQDANNYYSVMVGSVPGAIYIRKRILAVNTDSAESLEFPINSNLGLVTIEVSGGNLTFSVCGSPIITMAMGAVTVDTIRIDPNQICNFYGVLMIDGNGTSLNTVNSYLLPYFGLGADAPITFNSGMQWLDNV